MSEATWHKLSPWAALPVALGGLGRGGLLQALPGFVILGVFLANVDAIGWREVGLGAAALLFALGAYAVAWQQRFRYRIDEHGIAVQRGVVQRSEVELSWQRVRNVDLRQPFYLRPLERVALIVEGSGGQEEEIAIQAVRREFGERVRESLVIQQGATADPLGGLRAGGGSTPAGAEDGHAGGVVTVGWPPRADPATSAAGGAAAVDEQPQVLHQPTTGEILLHGAINGRAFGLLLAGIGAVFGALQPLISEADLVPVLVDVQDRIIGSGTTGLILAVPGLLVLSVLLVAVSAAIALVRFHDFQMLRDRDRFRIRHGLLETRERTLRTSKLQAVTVVETAVGRLLGRCHVLAHQASSASEEQATASDGTAEIPALTTGTVRDVVRRFDAVYGDWPPMAGVDPAFRRFWVIRVVVLPALAATVGVTALAVWGALSAALLAVLIALVAAVAILGVALVHGRWRHWGWVTDDEVVHIGSGLLGRRRETFRLDRVQHVTVRRTPYQRRHGLASLVLSLADGDRHVPFLHQEDAAALANLALFTSETRPHREL